MIRTDKRLRICGCLVCMLLIFIWGNSMLPGELSRAFSDWVKDILFPDRLASEGGQGSGLLRKIAHFTEFTALGVLLSWLFGMLQKGKWQPLLWGAAAACVDETIQFITPERAPGLKDVAIDTAGVLTGLILLTVGHTLLKRNTQFKFGGQQ